MKDRIRYDFGYYVLGILLFVFIWYFSFNLLHYPKANESLYLFFGGTVKNYSFNDDGLKEMDVEGLRKLEIVSSNPKDSTFDQKYNIVCFNSCDVALLPVSVLEKTACKTAFIELSDNYNLEYYTQEDVNYGLILSDELKESLGKYFVFEEEDYAIVIVAGSVNYGEITNNSFELISWMVGYETV